MVKADARVKKRESIRNCNEKNDPGLKFVQEQNIYNFDPIFMKLGQND